MAVVEAGVEELMLDHKVLVLVLKVSEEEEVMHLRVVVKVRVPVANEKVERPLLVLELIL